jgi:SAM-dependent methyltransferase
MTESWLSDVRDSYDNDAADYAEQVRGLLEARPFLRGSLTVFSELVRTAGGGPVADVGCGPGYVTRYLNDLGVDAFGIDLSPNMVALARRTYPDLRFEVGTMTDLSLGDDSVTGVLAFWSLIHIPDQSVPAVFAQFRRVMRPGGPLLVGFHVSDPGNHPDERDPGRSGRAETHHRRPDQIARWLREAEFSIEAELLMRPDEDVPGAIIIARNQP